MNNADFQTKNQNHDFNQNLESINFRCPGCSKLYSSDPSRIYVEEPEYTCSRCNTEFSISLLQALQNSEVVGSTIVHEVKKEVLPAQIQIPVVKAAKINKKELQEEFKLENTKASFSDLVEKKINNSFDDKWSLVLNDYDSRQAHNDFINFCKAEDDLNHAFERYSKLVKINPNDKLAVSFLKKIEFTIESKLKFNSVKTNVFFTKSFYITIGVVICGFFMITLGSLWFQNKNIAGLGIGLIFFTFAAKAFFQPRSLGD